MKKSKFTEQQIAFARQQAESGTKVAEVCRKMGISEATFYRWKQLYGGLMPSEVKKLRPARGRERAATQSGCRSDARQRDAAGGHPPQTMTPARGREMIDFVRKAFWRVDPQGVPGSSGMTCDLPLPIPPTRAGAPEEAHSRDCRDANALWHRRIHVLLRREGWHVNVKRVRRLYRLEGLQMRFKPPRRRVMAKLRDDRSDATGPNQVWAMDWMHDELFDGRRLRVLTVVDALEPGLSSHGGSVDRPQAMEVTSNDSPSRPGRPVISWIPRRASNEILP